MKLAFLLLLFANVALFAWQQGAFGRFAESGREPERIARQVEPERIRVLSEREVQVLRERAAAQTRAAATAAPPATSPPAATASIDLTIAQACVEFGDFIGPDLGRAETALLRLGLGSRQSARTVETPGWYLVYLPPFKTRAEADRAVADLKKSGVKDLLVLTDGPLRFGVGLGSFRDPELAKSHVATLAKLGVKTARVSDKPTAVGATRLQMRELDAETAQQLGAIAKEFPSQNVRACGNG
jgi:SPOR domain